MMAILESLSIPFAFSIMVRLLGERPGLGEDRDSVVEARGIYP
jgi:hypothetical protein